MMPGLAIGAGLSPRIQSPCVTGPDGQEHITEEAGITAPAGAALRVEMLVGEGEGVAHGQPVARCRDHPEVCFTAPMAATVASIRLHPGRKLSEVVLFRDSGGDSHHHPTQAETPAALRRLMQGAGLWQSLRRRPFGGMPAPSETPSALVVMAADTRPHAPDPRRALKGHEEAFSRGLAALATLTEGPVILCQSRGDALFDKGLAGGRITTVGTGPRHPQGLAGFHIHAHTPAALDCPVWDIHAEDVAALGDLLATGHVAATRLVRVAGAALRESRVYRTQPGADLRGLSQSLMLPGPHILLSGSALDGRQAHWLGANDRQVTALPREAAPGKRHWFLTALTRSALPKPVIPTSALTQAFGAALPAVALVRALASGDDETAMKLGVLSLLEEDVALADYVLGGEADLARLLRAALDRIAAEFAS